MIWELIMLLNLLEFAIALTISPLLFCWGVDIRNVLTGQTPPKQEIKPEAKLETKPGAKLEIKPKQTIKKARPAIKYESKPVVHLVQDGYPESLRGLNEPLYKIVPSGSQPLAQHLKELGLGGKQLNELKAAELRRLGTRMGIKNACRARKKDLLKQMRGKHGYA